MNSRDIAYQIRRQHKQPEPRFAESIESVDSVSLSEFWLQLDKLTNQPEAQPEIPVVLMTLDNEYPVGCIELQKNESGDWKMVIQTNEPYLA